MAEIAASLFAAAPAAAATASTAAASAAAWAAGTTVTTAAGVTTALAAPTSAALAGLQGALTLSSAASALFGGAMAYRQGQNQAMFAETDASGARLEAEQQAVRIRREMVEKVGAARVAYAASGMDISAGQPVEDTLRSQADYESGLAIAAGNQKSALLRANAGQLRSRGLAGLVEGASKAVGYVADTKLSIARRG